MIRIGVDFGGTKIEAAALDAQGEFRARIRKLNPGNYDAAVLTVRDLVAAAEQESGSTGATVGLGIPGSMSPLTGLIRNANSTWLNGQPFKQDLEQALGRPVRLQNDANCLALSEATDGAAAGAGVVFAAILGTGCGGGLVVNGAPIAGRNGIAGEWGHSPLPWPTPDEYRAHRCWCGQDDCLETWVSGTAFGEDYRRVTGHALTGEQVASAASTGDVRAVACLDRYIDRLGRAVAAVCNLVDPDIVVLGGGMSNVEALYARLPGVVKRHAFTDVLDTPIVKARFGDSSGVRGAAWLWPVA